MAENIKITNLTELNTADDADVLPIVDVDASTTKKITKSALLNDVHSDVSSLAAVDVSHDSDISSLASNLTANTKALDSDVSSLATSSSLEAVRRDSDVSSLAASIGTNDSDLSSLAATDVTHDSDISSLATASSLEAVSRDSDVSSLASSIGTNDSDISSLAASTSSLDDLSDVTITSASNEDVIKFDGTRFVNGQASVDVDTPINAGLSKALRGTENPHIGAFPNQSFKVIDNPKKLVMVIATDSGDLDFLLPDGGSIFLNTPTGGRLAPGFGFSVQEDPTEPDIEVASGGENYSVISGDSDTKGANGLPTRQGFNAPDIGANPAPLLISGGSIA